MTPKRKALLIRTILNFLSDETKRKNREMVKQNLFLEQKAFDYDDMFLRFAFLQDKDLEHISSKILG